MSTKARKIIGWILASLIAGFLCFSASAKLGLMDFPGKEEMFLKMGLTGNEPLFVGILEVTGALLFLFPRTGVIGALFLSAFVGGVIATHLEHDNNIIFGVVFETLVWIIAFIRFPELSQRILGKIQK